MRIELYQDTRNGWRWRAVDSHNRIIVDGAESFITRDGAEASADNAISMFRGDVKVVCRERRSAQRPEGTAPLYDVLVVAEYQAEGTLEHH